MNLSDVFPCRSVDYIIYFIIMIVHSFINEENIEGYYFDSITQSSFPIIHKVCNVGIFVLLIFKNV